MSISYPSELIDHSQIILAEEWDVDFWVEELGVSAATLTQLVATYGPRAERVREVLRQQRAAWRQNLQSDESLRLTVRRRTDRGAALRH